MSGDFMLAGNPSGIQVSPHTPSSLTEIYWSNKSSAIREEN